MKAAAILLLVGAAAALGWLLLAIFGVNSMASYLAAWLFVLAVPVGALSMVLMAEAFDVFSALVVPLLRRALLLLPVAAVLGIPVLFSTGILFRRPGIVHPLPVGWMSPGFFITRAVVILVVLSLLALVFSRTPARPRRGLAILGCLLNATLMSLAGFDWVMSLQPAIASSAFGVLLLASQISLAAALIAFLIAVAARSQAVLPDGLGKVVSIALAAWLFMQFSQFLVVWSANLPLEIVWYQARLAEWGIPAVAFGAVATALALALLPWAPGRVPAVVASLAAMLILLHLVEMLWLVTPAFRGRFTVTAPDLLAIVGMGGLLLGLLLVLGPRPHGEVHHAR